MNELYLYGTVGAGFWDEDCFTASGVAEALALMSGPLTVRLNSGGGIATEGQAIYNLLRDYGDTVDLIIDGIAASAASLIAMAGDTITMRAGSILMIHDPSNMWVDGRGTEEEHLRMARSLAVTANAYAGVYARRAGIAKEAAREIMKAETYYDGDAAVAAGFATAADDDVEAQIAARFDYRVYAHAPKELREAGAAFAKPTSRTAIMAMMAGRPAPNPKGKTMPKKNQVAMIEDEEVMTEDEEQMLEEQDVENAEDEADPEDETSAEGEETEGQGDDDEETAEPVAAQILDLASGLKRPTAEATDMIRRRLTLSQAAIEMNANRRKENPVAGKPRMGAQRAQIMRDERTTRRTGMAAAIAAQMNGTNKVPTNVRPFMDMSLVEMAAQCIDHRGPLRTTGQKIEVFMQAGHSTSDFPAIFENGLNKILLERYETAQPTYREIARRRDFKDFRPTPMIRVGDFPMLEKIAENGEIKFGTFGESAETAVLLPYARGLRVSRQMMINDDLGAIDELITAYGSMIIRFEEANFYAFALSAVLADGNPIFRTQRGNLAGSGTAITVASVSAGRAAMRKQKSIDGQNLNLNPTILLVGPDKQTEAEQLVASITANDTVKVNPLSGTLTVVVTPEITGNEWYLLAAGPASPWTYGYLDGAAAPRIRTDEPFGTQGMAMTVELDFGTGAVDFRGGYKNPGA